MNHSIYSADRTTHLKIVVVALVAGILVAGFGISAHTNSGDSYQTAKVIKAGKAVTITSSNTVAMVPLMIFSNSRGSLPAPQGCHVSM